MSDIAFIRNHGVPIAKAKALVQKAADSLVAEHQLESEWHGNTLRFQRPGVNGQIHVTDSKIHLDVSLGFLLKAFKAKFVSEIERNLDKYLPEPKSEVSAKKPAKKTAHTRS
ncbi:MAG: polyhydroxyalkanoic acid system family protein [Bryobacteraceae bacterium]|jgi:putative polyhydroxyalkanoate system protein